MNSTIPESVIILPVTPFVYGETSWLEKSVQQEPDSKNVALEDARNFAMEVVSRLRKAGFESLWAGGCVRDSLLGLPPKDYDVATNATPDQIRDLFGPRKTFAIGASFGVMTVLGNKKQGQIEVATFRQDSEYSDGRHPDSVRFSNAEQDAKRRDFTINGLFFDPIDEKVIDYVGGREDLHQKVIRAIGVANERISEDKLRMLRAIRFAATYDFRLDENTLEAIQENAPLLSAVSRERVAAEIRRMFVHHNRALAVSLLVKSKLLGPVFESPLLSLEKVADSIRHLELVASNQFATVLAVFLFQLLDKPANERGMAKLLAQQLNEWKFTNEESQSVWSVFDCYQTLIHANQGDWPQVQRVLIHENIEEILKFCESLSTFHNGVYDENVEYCRRQLTLPPQQLNPEPILNGDDLIRAGMQPGPHFRGVLEKLRDLQLNGQIRDFDEALDLARQWMEKQS